MKVTGHRLQGTGKTMARGKRFSNCCNVATSRVNSGQEQVISHRERALTPGLPATCSKLEDNSAAGQDIVPVEPALVAAAGESADAADQGEIRIAGDKVAHFAAEPQMGNAGPEIHAATILERPLVGGAARQ